ncbi:hypothetical protein JOM56_012533 [Amanita muscaria]
MSKKATNGEALDSTHGSELTNLAAKLVAAAAMGASWGGTSQALGVSSSSATFLASPLNIAISPSSSGTSQALAISSISSSSSSHQRQSANGTYEAELQKHGRLYCHFCQEPAQREEAQKTGGNGCIAFGTLALSSGPFVCHPCHLARKRAPSYRVKGFGLRRGPKMTWPIFILGLQLSSVDTHVIDSVMHGVGYQYHFDETNLNTLGSSSKKLIDNVQFIKDKSMGGMPPNMVVVVDTHADSFSGYLQVGGGSNAPKAINVGEMICKFVTQEVLQSMCNASALACLEQTELCLASGRAPWCDISMSTRGGWRGAIISSCRPSMLTTTHFFFVSKLVTDGLFDFVVGCGGVETLPAAVAPFMVALTSEMAKHGFPHVRKRDQVGTQLFKVPRLWDAFRNILINNQSVLDSTTVVFIFRDGAKRLHRMVSLHVEVYRPFGFSFEGCPNNCRAQFHLRTVSRHNKLRMNCVVCQWRSNLVPFESNEHFRVLHTSTPFVFWHEFPATHSAANLFINAK